MPVRWIQAVCADCQANLEAQSRHVRAIAAAAEKYDRGNLAQVDAIMRNLAALRDLHKTSADILFAAEAAVNALAPGGSNCAQET